MVEEQSKVENLALSELLIGMYWNELQGMTLEAENAVLSEKVICHTPATLHIQTVSILLRQFSSVIYLRREGISYQVNRKCTQNGCKIDS